MHGSDRVPGLNIDYERALVGRAKATASTRAKWRSSTSACCSVLENCLTPPTLSERRCGANNHEGDRPLTTPEMQLVLCARASGEELLESSWQAVVGAILEEHQRLPD